VVEVKLVQAEAVVKLARAAAVETQVVGQATSPFTSGD